MSYFTDAMRSRYGISDPYRGGWTRDELLDVMTYKGVNLMSMDGVPGSFDNTGYYEAGRQWNGPNTPNNVEAAQMLALAKDDAEMQRRIDYVNNLPQANDAAKRSMSYSGYDLYTMSGTGYSPDNSRYDAYSANKYLALQNDADQMKFRKQYVDMLVLQNENEAKTKELEAQTREIEAATAERERQSLLAAEQAGASPSEAVDVSAARQANRRRLIKSGSRRSLLNQTEAAPADKSLLGS